MESFRDDAASDRFRFSSVSKYVGLLATLVGKEAAKKHIQEWLKQQVELVDDGEFSAQFEAHFEKFKVRPNDFTHRILNVDDSEVLAGIRFYGGDSKRPFVDILAWQGELNTNALMDSVRIEWGSFAPVAIRFIRAVPSEDFAEASVYLDQSIHAARSDRLGNASAISVQLEQVDDLQEAHTRMLEKYADIVANEPALAGEISAATCEDLEDCRRNGTLDWIMLDEKKAGILGTVPGMIEFVPGHIIIEEVVFSSYNGLGLATAAQSSLSDTLPSDSSIIGTIQSLNHASRISAERAGRPPMFEYVFANL